MAIVELRASKRRRHAGEEEWFPLFEELESLGFAMAFIRAGESPAQMSTVNLWLECQIAGVRVFSPETGVACRKVLDRHDPAEIRGLASQPIPGQFNRRVA